MSHLGADLVVDNLAVDFLKRFFPAEGLPRLPNDPYPYTLKPNQYVWHCYWDGRWYPVMVLGPAPMTEEGYKVWRGVLGGPCPYNPKWLMDVKLCPMLGNAKPDDDTYARLLLQVHKRIPQDPKAAAMVLSLKEWIESLDNRVGA